MSFHVLHNASRVHSRCSINACGVEVSGHQTRGCGQWLQRTPGSWVPLGQGPGQVLGQGLPPRQAWSTRPSLGAVKAPDKGKSLNDSYFIHGGVLQRRQGVRLNPQDSASKRESVPREQGRSDQLLCWPKPSLGPSAFRKNAVLSRNPGRSVRPEPRDLRSPCSHVPHRPASASNPVAVVHLEWAQAFPTRSS